MQALKKLAQSVGSKPYNGFTKLSNGYHKIFAFRAVKNKFAKKGDSAKTILVELEKEVVFLPGYFWQKINEKDLADLNVLIEKGGEVFLYFGGKQKETE